MPATKTRAYEGLFLFGTSASANLDATVSSVRSLLEKHGGNVHVCRKFDDRKLAYEVKKQTRGVYVLTYFEAPSTAVEAVNREVNITDAILRCLITDASHLSAAEVEAMQPQKPAPRKTRDEDGPAGRRVGPGRGDQEGDGSSADAIDDDQVDAEAGRDADPAR